MKVSFRKGMSYGAVSGVITTLGLMIGLYFSSGSREIILAGVLTIAFADALSDGLGIHVSEESENKHSSREIWESTISAIMTKMLFALSFLFPIVFFPIMLAIILDFLWGMVLIMVLSYLMAKSNKTNPLSVVAEHVGIAILVVAGSFIIGRLISSSFN